MNDSIDCNIFERDVYWGIKNSHKTYEDNKIVKYTCVIQGNQTKEYMEEYLSNDVGKTVVLNE